MPSAYDEETFAQLLKWRTDHRATYLSSGGAEGHILDMSFLGGYRYQSMLLLRYAGRKSGKTYINAVSYCQFGPEILVLASLAGADHNPQWYENIIAGGPLAFQIATQAFNATWRHPESHEKEDCWTWLIKSNPIFAEYRKISKRDIPILMLAPQEDIPVFTEPG